MLETVKAELPGASLLLTECSLGDVLLTMLTVPVIALA